MDNIKYIVKVNRIVDGDTVNADICLGFDIWLRDQSIRLEGIDTPEFRTSDPEEKKYGLLAKQFLEDWCDGNCVMYLDAHVEKTRDKFGRVFGCLHKVVGDVNENAGDALVAAHHAVVYNGETKEELKLLHIANRHHHDVSHLGDDCEEEKQPAQ